MRLTTKTEYALICLRHICGCSEGKPVSIAMLSEKEKMPKDYVEQIFVRLRKAGVVKSVKGTRGGFMLAKSSSQITLKDIIEALEGDTFDIFCSSRFRKRIVCEHYTSCSVRPVWRRFKQLIDDFCSGVTLQDLTSGEQTLEKSWDLESFCGAASGAAGA